MENIENNTMRLERRPPDGPMLPESVQAYPPFSNSSKVQT
jgi:hypothetical protein